MRPTRFDPIGPSGRACLAQRIVATLLCLAAVTLFGSASAAWADDNALRAAQSQAAQVVVFARTAAILCPGVEVDKDAIHGLMDHAQITDFDIMSPDRFGREDEATARSFKSSTAENPAFCDKVLDSIEDRLHLVRRR